MKCLALFTATFLACFALTSTSQGQTHNPYWVASADNALPANALRHTPTSLSGDTRDSAPGYYERLPATTAPSRYASPAVLPEHSTTVPHDTTSRGSDFGFGNLLSHQLRQISGPNGSPTPIVGEPVEHVFGGVVDAPYQTQGHNWAGGSPVVGYAPQSYCEPRWQAGVDFLYMNRTTTGPVTVLVDDTTRTIPEFNSQELEFDYEFGVGARLSRSLGCGSFLDLGYFGVYDHNAFIERNGDLALVVPGFAVGFNPSDFAVEYESELHSGEISIRQQLCNRFALLAGFRYIRLRDDLLISSQIGPALTLNTYGIDASNNLYGFQLGSQVMVGRWGRFQVDALAKCGVYLNDAKQTTGSALTAIPSVTAHSETFAMGGEAGLFGSYCINKCWSVRAGYQVLGLNGVALAPEQLQQSNLTTGLAGIDASGSVFYHGGIVGLQYVR